MAVDAKQLYMPAVQPEHTVFYFHSPKAHQLADKLIVGLDLKAVKIRALRRPQFGILDDMLKRGILRDLPREKKLPAVVKSELCFTALYTHTKLSVGAGCYAVVLEAVFRPGKDIHITEYPREPELVLILEIGAVTPFQNSGGYAVSTRGKQACDVKLRGVVRDLGIACELTVDIQIKTAVGALKAEYAPQSVRRVGVVPAIDPDGDIIGNERRIVGYRVVDIGILRLVIAVELPV